MPRKMDLPALRSKSAKEVNSAISIYEATARVSNFWRRWVARMTVVEIHATWERYVENRLVVALNHDPKHFLQQQNIAGVTRISPGFARYIVRGIRLAQTQLQQRTSLSDKTSNSRFLACCILYPSPLFNSA